MARGSRPPRAFPSSTAPAIARRYGRLRRCRGCPTGSNWQAWNSDALAVGEGPAVAGQSHLYPTRRQREVAEGPSPRARSASRSDRCFLTAFGPITRFRVEFRGTRRTGACLVLLPVARHEDPQLAPLAPHPPSRQPAREAEGPRFHHQQDESALQGPPGLRLFGRGSALTSWGGWRYPAAMRIVVGIVAGALLLSGTASWSFAEEATPPSIAPVQPDKPAASKSERLDGLFATLKSTKSASEAKVAEGSILRLWLESGSDTIDLLMDWAMQGDRRQELSAGARLSRPRRDDEARLHRGLEQARHRLLPHRRLQEVDLRHRAHAGTRAAPLRRPFGPRHDHARHR